MGDKYQMASYNLKDTVPEKNFVSRGIFYEP